MRLGRLRTAEWHTIRHRLFSEKTPVRLCDLASLEVSIPTQLLTNLSTEFGPSILLNEITESAGKWALSSSGQDGLIDKFMALADATDTIAPTSACKPEIVLKGISVSTGDAQFQSSASLTGPDHEASVLTTPAETTTAIPEPTLERINTALPRSLSKATLMIPPGEAPLVEPALDSAVVIDVHQPMPLADCALPQREPTGDEGGPAPAEPCPLAENEAQQRQPDTSSVVNLIDRIPSARLIAELAALSTGNDSQSSLPSMGSHTSLNDSQSWPQDPTESEGDHDAAMMYMRIPPELKRQSTSQSTLHSDDPSMSTHQPTTARLLLDLSADTPLLTVAQIQTLLSSCFDATYHTRLTDHVTDPTNVELAARALRQLSPIVSLKHLSQVIHWMVSRVAERTTDVDGHDARPVVLAEVAAVSPMDLDRLGLRTGPSWPVLGIAKLLMIVTFDWTPDVAGLFVGYLCQSWPVHVVTRLMAMMAQDEPPSLASLFIKSATWPWSIMQVAELVSLMDCTLQWREAYFSAFMDQYLAHLQRDLSFYDNRTPLPSGAPVNLPSSHHPDGGLPLRPSPMSAFSNHTVPASVLLAKDKATRTLFLATLYRTSLAVQQFRLDAILLGMRGMGQLVERAAADMLVASDAVMMMQDADEEDTTDGALPGIMGRAVRGNQDRDEAARSNASDGTSSGGVSLGSLAGMIADAGWLDASGSRSESNIIAAVGTQAGGVQSGSDNNGSGRDETDLRQGPRSTAGQQ